LQGFIDPKSNPRRWNRINVHPFHIRALSGYAEEGQLFDAKSAWRSMIPVLIHVICMFTMNSTYRLIAEALTEWENHETTTEHRSSLIMKRFLFEAFDCYVGLFYLAFYERNVHRLSMELTAVFQIDTIRRIFLECIVPMLSQRVLHNVAVGRGLARDYTYSSRKTIQPTEQTILEDLEKDEYEQFDDYMEIIIQVGYVTLFASALVRAHPTLEGPPVVSHTNVFAFILFPQPLGSLIAIVANWVEIRSDCFKLTYLCRRPDSFRASGLGVWRILMSCVIWTSALTNCLIVGFTSGQLMHYMPDIYIRDSQGVNNFGHEDGWLAVLVIFGLERALLLLGLVVYWAIPSVPEDVADQLERRQFLRMEKISDSMFASTMRFSQMDASVLLGGDDDDDDYHSSRKKDA
jgi:anoctamin-10